MFENLSKFTNLNSIAGLNNFSEELQKSFANIIPNPESLKNGDFSELLKNQKINNINFNLIFDTFKLQDQFNENVVPQWKVKNLDWWMAIDDEIMEILNSVNWKWWKNAKNLNEVGKKVDMDNVEVEMIDLFHFLISKGIEQKKDM